MTADNDFIKRHHSYKESQTLIKSFFVTEEKVKWFYTVIFRKRKILNFRIGLSHVVHSARLTQSILPFNKLSYLLEIKLNVDI